MSRQSSQLPEEGRAASASKKRHGRFEIWAQYDSPKWGSRWSRWRKYATRELAEKNLTKMKRELKAPGWKFEIREIE